MRQCVSDASRRPRLRSWFKEFDLNQDGELDRNELRQLLLVLHPEHPPDDKLLDMLIERATAVESYSLQLKGSKDGSVSRMAAEKTIQRFDAYIRQKETLDDIFMKHDKDEVRLALPSPAPPPPVPCRQRRQWRQHQQRFTCSVAPPTPPTPPMPPTLPTPPTHRPRHRPRPLTARPSRPTLPQSGNLDRVEVLSMMNEIIGKTRGFMHIVATEGDVEYLMASCDEDGARAPLAALSLPHSPCRAPLAAFPCRAPLARAEAAAESQGQGVGGNSGDSRRARGGYRGCGTKG